MQGRLHRGIGRAGTAVPWACHAGTAIPKVGGAGTAVLRECDAQIAESPADVMAACSHIAVICIIGLNSTNGTLAPCTELNPSVRTH